MLELELVPSQKTLNGTPRAPGFPNLAFAGQPAPPKTESPRPSSAARLPKHHARSVGVRVEGDLWTRRRNHVVEGLRS